MHADLSDAAISCQHDVQLSVAIIDYLNLVEDVVAIWAVLKVNLSQVGVPWVLLVIIVDLILLFTSKLAVDRHVVKLLLLLEDFVGTALLGLFKEGLRIGGEIVSKLWPAKHRRDRVAAEADAHIKPSIQQPLQLFCHHL